LRLSRGEVLRFTEKDVNPLLWRKKYRLYTTKLGARIGKKNILISRTWFGKLINGNTGGRR